MYVFYSPLVKYVCLCWQYSRIIYFKPETNSPEWIFHNLSIFYLKFIFLYLCCMGDILCVLVFLEYVLINSFILLSYACILLYTGKPIRGEECLFCALWGIFFVGVEYLILFIHFISTHLHFPISICDGNRYQ